MSKKLWSTSAWAHSQSLRARKRARRVRVTRRAQPIPKEFRETRVKSGKGIHYQKLFIPEIFSLLKNPDEIVEFLNKARRIWKHGKHVYFRFDNVSEIGVEAIAALTATIEFHHGRSAARGNLPKDPRCREIVIQSDMLSHTDSNIPVPSRKSGKMFQRNSKRVEVSIARDLVKHATEQAFGQARKLPAVYRALLEGMQNTYDHADKESKGEENWMATVYADAKVKQASFTLLDSGVGIFKSVRIARIRAFFRSMGIEKNTDVLKDVLDSKIPSSTGLKYRGKGLPSFRDAAKRGTLKNVTIISNDVFANVSNNDYRELKSSFDGTLLYWEVTE